jgi:hypothetical protein
MRFSFFNWLASDDKVKLGDSTYKIQFIENSKPDTNGKHPPQLIAINGKYLQLCELEAGFPRKLFEKMINRSKTSCLAQIADMNDSVIVVDHMSDVDEVVKFHQRGLRSAPAAVDAFFAMRAEQKQKSVLSPPVSDPTLTTP